MKNLSFNKGRPHCLCIFIFAVLLSNQINASELKFGSCLEQMQQQITGTVTDASGPLPGVTVIVKATNVSTVTDEKGNFSIAANSDDILVFSFLSYASQEIIVGSETSIKVLLSEDSTTLKEVTINAGYYSVKDKDRTGSIARITSKDIEKQPVTNPLASMQGRMSGVNISQSAGTPGSGFSIQIRGINSLRGDGNDPLYIVNGVPYASQSLGNSDVSAGQFGGLSNPISNINPADIESIEVLKDADATAIYGSRGANGVVLITTKKGKSGRTKFDVQTYTTIGKITKKMDLLNTQQYLAIRSEAFANDGISDYPDDAYDINGTWDQSRYTDWQKELIGGTANIYNTQFSVSGGSAGTQFLLSGTYRKETTVFPGDAHFYRGAVSANITHRSEDDKFSLTFTANYTGDKNTLPGTDLTRLAYTLAPNAPALYDPSGNLNWENGSFENPLSYLNGTYINSANTLLANALLSYKLPAGFEVRTSLGFSDAQLSEERSLPNTMYNPFYGLTSDASEMVVNDGKRRSWIVEPQLNWQKKWQNFQINVLAGTTFQMQKQKAFALDAYGFASNALMNSVAAATTITVLNDSQSEYKYNAVFGRINLSLKDRYILNITGRRDGSSRFGPGNRFANFGALGAAWIFSNESLLSKDNSILSFGKLRASYGITGNDQIGDYQYLDTYQVTPNLYDGVVGIQPTRLFNPDFGWETNKKLEAAIELGFLKDQIFITAAYFQNRSSNQLVGIPLPATTGFPSLQSNLDATVQNTGLELDLRSVNLKSENFTWTTSLNFTLPKNKLLAFPDLDASTYKNKFIIGQSIYIRKLYHYTGLDPATGLYTVEDVNSDGKITAAGDLKSFIDFSPKYYGGITNQLSYKNLTLDFLFQFVKQKGAGTASLFPVAGSFSNQPVQAMNHFPQDGTNAANQLYTTGVNADALSANDNYTLSDAMIQDASFIRLKSLSLSYTIPLLWSKNVSTKIYVQGQNLLTFTKYKGADPENQSANYIPPLKQFTLGVQLTF
ncbi:SusC/RagA family TonB-linked outer membrane protein [Flavobacterium pectinovorum]|uniref:SusC/RagA family protein n=1 Tax=Flavobacterium pectinovorum TaxID=29533 RepID=A0AB36P5W4_9FLAO|nr:TonB-dependent receptor [Flavobacterium pectinovorum]OXB07810.1 SusC/RagA family protein [Flavobacterium pectinovorum]SHM81219.1 TonB-linked outer membrane protein, SusC/RagA family [Flavobacterium pectinovorum]